MKPVARFFCENCHAEVSARDKVCPSCGRFFSLVRCPRCGLTGEARRFRHGCPSCGYTGTEADSDDPASPTELDGLERLPLEEVDPESGRRRTVVTRSDGKLQIDLPPGFYLTAGIILLVLLALILYWLLSGI